MNKTIQKQLNNVKIADLSNFNEETNTYYIPKYVYCKLDVGKYYLICLDDSLLNENNNLILKSNWRNKSTPQCKYMKVDVVKNMNKMVLINGVGYDNNTKEDLNYFWYGWLPVQNIKVISNI